jgi:hypothetical protein
MTWRSEETDNSLSQAILFLLLFFRTIYFQRWYELYDASGVEASEAEIL